MTFKFVFRMQGAKLSWHIDEGKNFMRCNIKSVCGVDFGPSESSIKQQLELSNCGTQGKISSP